jgi:hypothetical protein
LNGFGYWFAIVLPAIHLAITSIFYTFDFALFSEPLWRFVPNVAPGRGKHQPPHIQADSSLSTLRFTTAHNAFNIASLTEELSFFPQTPFTPAI